MRYDANTNCLDVYITCLDLMHNLASHKQLLLWRNRFPSHTLPTASYVQAALADANSVQATQYGGLTATLLQSGFHVLHALVREQQSAAHMCVDMMSMPLL